MKFDVLKSKVEITPEGNGFKVYLWKRFTTTIIDSAYDFQSIEAAEKWAKAAQESHTEIKKAEKRLNKRWS